MNHLAWSTDVAGRNYQVITQSKNYSINCNMPHETSMKHANCDMAHGPTSMRI